MAKNYVLSLSDNEKYGDSYEEIFQKKLEDKGLFIPTNIYRAMGDTPNLRKLIRKVGTDHPEHDTLMVLTHSDIFVHNVGTGIFDYACVNGVNDKSMIVVYDGNQLEQKLGSDYQHFFKTPQKASEAVLATFKIKWGDIVRDNASWVLNPK